MRAVYKRELQSFFCTPHAYVFTGVFLLLGSVFFAVGNLAAHSSDLNGFLWNAGYLWMLLTPVLTMHVYAGERRAHTDQLLFSSPVSLWGVALGKYLATITVLGLTVFLSLIYAGLIAIYGRLYPSEALCGYLGFSLQGSAFVAIDLYVSARSRTPVTAAVWAFGINLLLWLVDVLSSAVSSEILQRILEFISPYQRCVPFRSGQLSAANTLYFIGVSVLMLFLTVRTLDSRRWREA